MNQKLCKYSSIFTGICVVIFAISMIMGLMDITAGKFISYFTCIFLAIGYVAFVCSLKEANKNNESSAFGNCAVAFGMIYAILVIIVYYAQCTTLNLNTNLNNSVLEIIDYSKLGSLFFNYDLLGYGFMALSTFFISFSIKVSDKDSLFLKRLLLIHGVFFIPCLVMPMFPVFTASTQDLIGVFILEMWCIYFLPICILGYKYFSKLK